VLDTGTPSDPYLERVSRDRVVPAPRPPGSSWTPATAHAYQSANPITWPAPAGFNMADLPRRHDDPRGVSSRMAAAATPSTLLTNALASPQPSGLAESAEAPVAASETPGTTAPSAPANATHAPDDHRTSDETPADADPPERRQPPVLSPEPPDARASQAAAAPGPPPTAQPSALADATRAAMADLAAEANTEAPTSPSPDPRPKPPLRPPSPVTVHETASRQPHRTREYVINRIVAHEIADGSEPSHPAGQWLYRIRWYGFGQFDDTWEPIEHLPRSHVQRYHKKRKLPLPPDIDKALIG